MRRFGPALLALAAVLSVPRVAAAAPPPVVGTTWVAERLAAHPAAFALVDARGTKAFLAAHLPGAQPLHPENLRSAAGGVPATLYPAEVLQLAARRLGIGPATHVVVYSETSDVDATYVAAALQVAGVASVSVLDGGFAKWSAEKRPVTSERTLMTAAAAPLATGPAILATLADVRHATEAKGALLLDARPAEQYEAGHIPGALNRFWQKDVADGAFRPETQVRAELEAMGVTKEKPVIVYCNTGHQASELYFTLKDRLGYADVRLYNGSWIEWAMTPGTPRETGTPGK